MRSRLYLTRPKVDADVGEPPPEERVLRHFKSNYSGLKDDILLTYQDGVFVADDRPGGILKSITDRKAEKAFLASLDKATAQRRNVSDYASAANFAPRVFAKMPEADRSGARNLTAAMHRLFAAGTIVMGSPFTGPDRKPRRGIIPTDNTEGHKDG